MKMILSLIVAFAIALAFVVVNPVSLHASTIDDPNPNFSQGDNVIPGSYIIVLKNETFAEVDQKFPDKEVVTANNVPEINAKVDPALKHEYIMETSAIINDKVEQYNGTDSPLAAQGAKVDDVWIHAIRGFSVEGVDDISVFVNDPDIQTVEPDTIMEKNLEYTPQGFSRVGSLVAQTQAYKKDNIETKLNVDIAVIDGRVSSHPDLYLHVYSNSAGGTNNPDSHGTGVAGICCARDNLGGVIGIAPGARVWSLSACNDSGCSMSGIINALNFATTNAASIEVATMSIGDFGSNTPTPSATETAADNMVDAGVTFIMAAGNDNVNADNSAYCDISDNGALCVSAWFDNNGKCGGGIAPDDTRASFSNFGSAVDIMGPGNNILTTSPPGQSNIANRDIALPYIGFSSHGAYWFIGGTSSAAPHVAGAAALVKLDNPSSTPAQVKADLISNAYPQTLACDGLYKGGLVSGANSESSEPLLWTGNY